MDTSVYGHYWVVGTGPVGVVADGFAFHGVLLVVER